MMGFNSQILTLRKTNSDYSKSESPKTKLRFLLRMVGFLIPVDEIFNKNSLFTIQIICKWLKMLKSPFRSTWDALPDASECRPESSDCDFNASECDFKASDYDFKASDFYPETSEHYLKAFDSYFTFSKRKLWGNDKNIGLLFALV